MGEVLIVQMIHRLLQAFSAHAPIKYQSTCNASVTEFHNVPQETFLTMNSNNMFM